MAVPYLACMALVASIYHLPPRVLPAIHLVEGGVPGSVSRNLNGTDDLGVMQVNTIWLPAFARMTHLTEAEVRDRLVNRSCFNIAAAGAIMRLYMDEAQGDLLRAVGYYHSHTPALNAPYQLKVIASARFLFKSSPSGTAPR